MVILSYEDFIQQLPRFRVPELLKDFFARHGFTAEAIVVLKPQSEHLNSIYTHRAQMIREYQCFERFAPAYAGTRRFDYDALIEPWLIAFSGRLRAIPVRDRRTDAPIFLRLIEALQLDDRIAPLLRANDPTCVMNRSPGPVAVEISRRIRTTRMHARLRVLPRVVMRFVERETAARDFDRDRFRGVTPEMRDQMERQYRPANERFAHSVWQTGWDDIVEPETVGRGERTCACADRSVHRMGDQGKSSTLAAQKFEVAAQPSIFSRPINRLIVEADALQRRVGYSRWRVL